MSYRFFAQGAKAACAVIVGIYVHTLAGCVPVTPPDSNENDNTNGSNTGFNNTTDPTNDGARFIGSAACLSCHPAFADDHERHAHANALKEIEGLPPQYPDAAQRAGVPAPPEDFGWEDISYVIGGHLRGANFVDLNGFLLTNGVESVQTQWNLEFLANGTDAAFAPYQESATTPPPFDHDCFRCHVTGGTVQDDGEPRFQDNRAGIAGTWSEAGVQCEACHGPGSNHAPNPSARALYVNSSASACAQCHARNNDVETILGGDGFILGYQQNAELAASGGHSSFSCTICHAPHVSMNYDRDRALRNQCTDCHADQSFARHEGKTFVRGDYVEELSCESCHMPYATRTVSNAGTDVVGDLAKVGDMRTHIFRISTEDENFSDFLSGGGETVQKDAQGRAAVTVDYVCMRCHNGLGNAFPLTVQSGSLIATGLHAVIE